MKKILLLSIIILSSVKSFADFIDDGNTQFYGKIIFINTQKIILNVDCTDKTQEFTWSDNLTVNFSDSCIHPAWDLSTSPVTAQRNCPQKKVFEFLIISNGSSCYADEFSIKDDKLHIVYSNGKGTKDLSVTDLYKTINWVRYSTVCESDIPKDFKTF